MILWGRASSVNVQKVLWALHELDLPSEHKIVGGKYGGLDDPAFRKMTPVGRVPVLQDGDVTVWESNAILRYLARGHITPVADMWMDFGATTLQPPFIGMFWQQVRMTPEQQNAQALAGHLDALNAGLAVLDRGLSDGRCFIAGSDFSMADVALGSLFYRILDLNPDLLAKREYVAAWHENIASRAGYQRWISTSYQELRV